MAGLWNAASAPAPDAPGPGCGDCPAGPGRSAASGETSLEGSVHELTRSLDEVKEKSPEAGVSAFTRFFEGVRRRGAQLTASPRLRGEGRERGFSNGIARWTPVGGTLARGIGLGMLEKPGKALAGRTFRLRAGEGLYFMTLENQIQGLGVATVNGQDSSDSPLIVREAVLGSKDGPLGQKLRHDYAFMAGLQTPPGKYRVAFPGTYQARRDPAYHFSFAIEVVGTARAQSSADGLLRGVRKAVDRAGPPAGPSNGIAAQRTRERPLGAPRRNGALAAVAGIVGGAVLLFTGVAHGAASAALPMAPAAGMGLISHLLLGAGIGLAAAVPIAAVIYAFRMLAPMWGQNLHWRIIEVAWVAIPVAVAGLIGGLLGGLAQHYLATQASAGAGTALAAVPFLAWPTAHHRRSNGVATPPRGPRALPRDFPLFLGLSALMAGMGAGLAWTALAPVVAASHLPMVALLGVAGLFVWTAERSRSRGLARLWKMAGWTAAAGVFMAAMNSVAPSILSFALGLAAALGLSGLVGLAAAAFFSRRGRSPGAPSSIPSGRRGEAVDRSEP